MAVLQRATEKPVGSIFIFNFAAADFAVANKLELIGNLRHPRNGGDFGFLERIPENRRGVNTGHPLTIHICAVQSVHKCGTAHHALGSSNQELHCHLCAPEKNLVIWFTHVSPFVALSLAVYHEHIFFLIHYSFYHDTRTRTAIGST